MALKPCRECKRKVSTEATTCPRCGVPNPTSKSSKKDKRVNIQHGVEYCAECGTELPSGPPCNQPNCRLAVISPRKKNKPISKDQYNIRREKAEKEIIDKYFDGRSADNNPSPKGDGFWNGTEGLAKTFWLYFIGGNAVGNLLALLAESEGSGMVMFVIVIIIAWNIFAIMGVFNAADIYKNQMIKVGQSYGYATAAKVAVVLLILSSIGNAL